MLRLYHCSFVALLPEGAALTLAEKRVEAELVEEKYWESIC